MFGLRKQTKGNTRADWFKIVFLGLFNKLTSVFLCVCPLIDDKLRYDIVKVAVVARAAFSFNKRTDA